MEPRIAVMSYDRLTEAINRHVEKEVKNELLLFDVKFDETLDLAKELINQHKVDVIIAGSGNFKTLKDKIDFPLVEFEITGYDVMNVLSIAKLISDKVAIVTYKEEIYGIKKYTNILNIEVRQYIYYCIDELTDVILRAKEEGFNVLIGSSIVCDYGDLLGMNTIFIYTDECIKRAINYAFQLQRSIQDKIYEAELTKTILNYAYSGIMATDEFGNIISINPMAERILGIQKDKDAADEVIKIITSLNISESLKSQKWEIDQIQRIKNKIILTSKVPLLTNSGIKGVVVTFQDIKSIQKSEHKIRRELYSKGLVAKYSFEDIKGSSKLINNCIETARQYAKSDFTILITGESGTGKELFAHSIHNESERKDEAFVAVNCAALPENLLESELFGYEEGAFTGARKGGKMGLFELAHNGTIFLDEISEIPLSLQSRLLRVIQEKEVMRLGSDKIIPVDVRIISATNKDLWQEVVSGRFREDLYYRLSVLELTIPSLRERKTDIPEISRDFVITNFPNLYNAYEKKWERIFKLLQGYEFYGNVRELQNVLKRLSVLIGSDSAKNKSEADLIENVYKEKFKPATIERNDHRELNQIMETLSELGWNKEKAAKKLGISRTTLWRKLKTYGIE